MVDSGTVLWGQAIAYTIYVLGAMLVVGWFAYRVTRAPGGGGVRPAFFWSFFGLLIVSGVALHIVSYNTIPWTPTDVHRAGMEADKTFAINVADHEFQFDAPLERRAPSPGTMRPSLPGSGLGGIEDVVQRRLPAHGLRHGGSHRRPGGDGDAPDRRHPAAQRLVLGRRCRRQGGR